MEEKGKGKEDGSWPMVVRDSHGVVKVYKCLNNRHYITYMLSYYFNGQRVRKGFSSPQIAMREARVVARSLSTGWGSLVKIPLDRYKTLLKAETKLKEIEAVLENLEGGHE